MVEGHLSQSLATQGAECVAIIQGSGGGGLGAGGEDRTCWRDNIEEDRGKRKTEGDGGRWRRLDEDGGGWRIEEEALGLRRRLQD